MSDQKQESGKPAGRRSRTLGQLAMEVFSIVLGVLLALGVSEWQEDRNNRERAALALSNVRAELDSNLQLLEFIHPANMKIVERMTAGERNGDGNDQFIPGVQIRSSAWQTLGSTGLSNYVDFSVLVELSQLYSIIEVYRQTSYGFITSSMSLAATATAMDTAVDNQRFSENFLSYFQMMVGIETALIEVHRKTMDRIDEVLLEN